MCSPNLSVRRHPCHDTIPSQRVYLALALYSPYCLPLSPLYTHGSFPPFPHTSGPRATYFDTTGGVVKACEAGFSSLGSPNALDSASCFLACPAGQSLTADGSTCADCARGKYANEPLPTCKICRTGRHSNGEVGRKIECERCPLGKVSPAESADISDCTPCAAGRFSDVIDTDTCKVCPTGRFEDSLGSTECKKCQLGTVVAAGVNENASFCIPCTVGRYSNVNDVQTCKACPIARYEDSLGSTKCKACPYGSYENLGTTEMARADQCIECGRGRYGTQNASTSSRSCVNCAPGKYSYLFVASECKPCPAGREALDERTPICSPCAAGKVRMGNAEACAPCSNPSEYAAVTADECKECGPGEHLNVNRSGCDRCPAGRFSETPGATSISTCTPCPVCSLLEARNVIASIYVWSSAHLQNLSTTQPDGHLWRVARLRKLGRLHRVRCRTLRGPDGCSQLFRMPTLPKRNVRANDGRHGGCAVPVVRAGAVSGLSRLHLLLSLSGRKVWKRHCGCERARRLP